jgi:hypothetical protein
MMPKKFNIEVSKMLNIENVTLRSLKTTYEIKAT